MFLVMQLSWVALLKADPGDTGTFDLLPHLLENLGIFSIKQADGPSGELHVGGLHGPELEVAHITLTHILLAKTKSHGCTQLQGRLGNVGKGRRDCEESANVGM